MSKIEVTDFNNAPHFPDCFSCLLPEAASQQYRSGVTDEDKQSVREQLRQYQSGGETGTFPTVAVNCGQLYTSIYETTIWTSCLCLNMF